MTDAPNPIDIAVGGRVRLRREMLGYTQSDVAAAVGITFQQVQKYERGMNRISASRLVHIASFLKTTGAALLGETDSGAEPRPSALLRTAGALDLLKAYRSIASSKHRQGLVAMARSLGPSRAG